MFELNTHRIIILGGPRVGKTTLSKRLQKELGIPTLNCADDLKDLGWSESSEAASKWFDNKESWICEGVQMARALRKWLKANPDVPLDADVLYLKQPFVALLPGQLSMTKGVRTVFGDIEADLVSRGARVHELKDPEDAINLLSGVDMTDDNDGGQDKPDNKETAGLKKRLDKHQGDAMALAAELSAENADLHRQLSAAKGAKPKEGSVVLTPEQAKHWEAFVALGKPEEVITSYQEYVALGKVEDIKTKLTEHGTLTTDNATLKRAGLLRQIADDNKYDLEVFTVLDEKAGVPEYQQREVTADGKVSKVWEQKVSGKWVPVEEFHANNSKPFLSSLKAPSTSREGVKVIGQTADDKTAGTKQDIGEEFFKKAQEARDKRINPLAKTA